MSNIKSVLSKRFEKPANSSTKMDKLANQSSAGSLSSFSGVFKIDDLSVQEKLSLKELLKHYSEQEQEISRDLEDLTAITSEVKAINNQAIILHGERIKRAQNILKSYKDGAFSCWLITVYGNRSTPYNFLQYYEFYISLSKAIQQCIDAMPRQAVYTLASRQGPIEAKERFILGHQGESKNELLAKIRLLFPLDAKDLRKENHSAKAIRETKKLIAIFSHPEFNPSHEDTEELILLINQLRTLVLGKKVN
ncbi:MAG: CT583 family protein [Chlamydiota bacterium]